MGNCTFVVHTVGCHGNTRENGKHYKGDAEVLLEEIIELLSKAGHSIREATVTHGGEYRAGVSRKAEPDEST